jgi:PDZ domain-containing protein
VADAAKVAAMGRRGATLALGAVLLLLLIWQAGTAPVPYVELGPGPTENTLGARDGKPIITIDGRGETASAGQLRLTTVNVRDNLTLLDAVRGWFSDDSAVVPRELIYPPDKTEQQVDEENANSFKESQTSAETVAMRKLGYPVLVTVTEVTKGSPAEAVIKVGDVLTTVDGVAVTSSQKLRELIRAKPAGTALQVGYTRDGVAATVPVSSAAAEDGAPRLGVVVEHKQPAPFDVTFDLDRIGGPSAGLMFTLGIIDKIDPVDLTGGVRIAGTGTIDDEGNVGPIGGIPQKLRGAKRDRAKAFLVPAANCAEAKNNAVAGLPLFRVATVDDALAALQALRDKRTPTLC